MVCFIVLAGKSLRMFTMRVLGERLDIKVGTGVELYQNRRQSQAPVVQGPSTPSFLIWTRCEPERNRFCIWSLGQGITKASRSRPKSDECHAGARKVSAVLPSRRTLFPSGCAIRPACSPTSHCTFSLWFADRNKGTFTAGIWCIPILPPSSSIMFKCRYLR